MPPPSPTCAAPAGLVRPRSARPGVLWLAAGLLAWCAAPGGAARADEPTAELADLKARLERLEKLCDRLAAENEALKKGAAAPAPPDAAKVEELAGRYLEAQEKKKKEAEEQAKKKEQEGFVVGDSLKFDGGAWRNGLVFETADKAFRVQVGGRVHADAAWWEAPQNVMFGPGGVGPLEDGANFRRARIRVNGAVYETVHWVMEYGFETGQPQFFDVYGELPNLPYVGAVRVGHFREPFSMDALTSGNYLTFMERSLIQDAFVPFRNTGIMAYDAVLDERATWALGVFRSNSNAVGSDAGDGDYALTGRLTANPWYERDGACALHLGVASSHRTLPELNASGNPVGSGGLRRVSFATRPEIRVNAPNFANTGLIAADSENLVGAELGLGLGPFLFQGEYVAAMLDGVGPRPGVRAGGGAPFFQGFYVQASYFLTGESRPYVRTQGVFGQVRPHENFFWVRDEGRRTRLGRGAWEVGVRYSHLDLDSQGIQGGRLDDVTVGLNWYLNPNSRVMGNYILVWRDAPGGGSDGLTQILGTRFQVDF
jgi:phosphate-selective porin OprO/OprP